MSVHVLQLIHNLKREGAQSMVANLSMALDAETTTITVYPWREGGPYAGQLRKANLAVVEQPVSGWARRFRAALSLRRFVKTEHVDLVHAHMSDSAILAAVVLIGTGVPLVVTHHSNRLLPKAGRARHLARRQLLSWASRRAALNIGVTQSVAVRLREELGLPEEKVACIANGVAVPLKDSADDARLSRIDRRNNAGWPRIAALGRLAPVKRQDIAIEAMCHVRKCFPEARLLMAGDGPLMGDLAALVERLDLRSCVTLAGSTDDVAGMLRGSDLFVSTSAYEGLPVAVLEAMSWGLPVIATNVPGHCDVIRDGVDGCLVPFEDPMALAHQIVRIAGDASNADALGDAARQRVLREFSAARMAGDYARAYASLARTPATCRADVGDAIRL